VGEGEAGETPIEIFQERERYLGVKGEKGNLEEILKPMRGMKSALKNPKRGKTRRVNEENTKGLGSKCDEG